MRSRNDGPNMSEDPPAKLPEATVSEFFESKSVNVEFRITGLEFQPGSGGAASPLTISAGTTAQLKLPAIRLWCDFGEFDGFRTFQPIDASLYVPADDSRDKFVEFICRNCRRSRKKYAVSYRYNTGDKELIAVKLGEDPPLSLHLSSRLRKLVGSDLEKFNKGLRSEAHGLGVGAFAYYRPAAILFAQGV
jgi:hypothetical protein